MNLQIVTTLFKFWFSTIKNLLFHLQILISKVLLLRDHNVNTSFYKHVLCHPTNDKSGFIFVSIQKATNTLNLLTKIYIFISVISL